MQLGQYYHLYVNYCVAAEALKSRIPKSVDLDLFENRPVVSWVVSTWQDLKMLSLPWGLNEQSFSLSLRTYVKFRRDDEWIRGYFPLESWMSGSKNKLMKRLVGMGSSGNFECKRSVHFEPFEKSSKGIFEYKWSDPNRRGEQVMRFRTLGSPQPAMAGYLEYFTAEKNHSFVASKNKVTIFQEERLPSMLWELDETILPTHFPGEGSLNCDWATPSSTFVVKGSKVSIRKLATIA